MKRGSKVDSMIGIGYTNTFDKKYAKYTQISAF